MFYGQEEVVRRGRRSRFSPSAMETICEALADGDSLAKASKAAGVDPASVRRWCRKDEEVARRYALARDAGIRAMEERLLELCEELTEAAKDHYRGSTKVQAIRTEIETRKWILCKRYPREYGDAVGGALASLPQGEKWLRKARQEEAANEQERATEFRVLMNTCKDFCRTHGQ